jgi:hypothetical protein
MSTTAPRPARTVARRGIRGLRAAASVLALATALATAPAASASDIPSLGVHLSGVRDYASQHPFLDRAKTARDWAINDPAGDFAVFDPTLPLDEDGWPTRVPAGKRLITAVGVDPTDDAIADRYVVLFDGEGELAFIGADVVETKAGRRTVEMTNTEGDGFTHLFVLIAASDPNDHVRNIRVVREDQLKAFEAGEIFNPAFLARLKDFTMLRFMDWMGTNDSVVTTPDTRRRVADASWTNENVWESTRRAGVPIEIVVELANRVGADAWINVPHKADDALVRAYAEIVRDRLDPRLKVYVEYSNEVWNFGFGQAADTFEAAQARWSEAFARRCTGNPDRGTAWMQLYGLRAAEVMDIFADVFGKQAKGRLVRVAATQTAFLGLEEAILEAPFAVCEGKRPPKQSFDAYAVTGYFEGGLYADGNISFIDNVPQVREFARQGAQGIAKAFRQMDKGDLFPTQEGFLSLEDPSDDGVTTGLRGLFAYHAEVARENGLKLVAYEGGPHLFSSFQTTRDLTDFFAKLNRDKRMGELVTKMLDMFKDAGGTRFAYFADVEPYTEFGFWGALESVYQKRSAKFDAITEWSRDNTLPDRDRRDPEAFIDGVVFAGGNKADTRTFRPGNDRAGGGKGRDVFDGGPGSDVLDGGPDKDTLTGGAGPDRFRIASPKEAGDTITDFTAIDRIVLPAKGWTGLEAGKVRVVAGTAATSAKPTFLFDATTGRLSFDRDGTGPAKAVAVATLAGATKLKVANIEVE